MYHSLSAEHLGFEFLVPANCMYHFLSDGHLGFEFLVLGSCMYHFFEWRAFRIWVFSTRLPGIKSLCTKYLHFRLTSLSALCSYVFILSLTLALLTKHTNREWVDVFSIAAQVFSNLFLKICPLFGQILIACLKCSRASFSLSSYSEKMRWGRGWRSCNLPLVTLSKGFGVRTSSAGEDTYFICHMTPQDHFIEVPRIFMRESSSQQVTTLKSGHRHSDS